MQGAKAPLSSGCFSLPWGRQAGKGLQQCWCSGLAPPWGRKMSPKHWQPDAEAPFCSPLSCSQAGASPGYLACAWSGTPACIPCLPGKYLHTPLPVAPSPPSRLRIALLVAGEWVGPPHSRWREGGFTGSPLQNGAGCRWGMWLGCRGGLEQRWVGVTQASFQVKKTGQIWQTSHLQGPCRSPCSVWPLVPGR